MEAFSICKHFLFLQGAIDRQTHPQIEYHILPRTALANQSFTPSALYVVIDIVTLYVVIDIVTLYVVIDIVTLYVVIDIVTLYVVIDIVTNFQSVVSSQYI